MGLNVNSFTWHSNLALKNKTFTNVFLICVFCCLSNTQLFLVPFIHQSRLNHKTMRHCSLHIYLSLGCSLATPYYFAAPSMLVFFNSTSVLIHPFSLRALTHRRQNYLLYLGTRKVIKTGKQT